MKLRRREMENIQMTKSQFIKIKNIYKIKNKGSKTRKNSLSNKWCWDTQMVMYKRIKLGPYLIPQLTQNRSKT